ncbi:MAG: cytochrome c peroxidase [Planctomycetota bacterium]
MPSASSLRLAFTAVFAVLVPSFAIAQNPGGPPGLPPVPVPAQNPITPAKAVLGKILFWDEQLSANNTVACGTCHRPSSGGGDPRRSPHPGLDGVLGTADDTFGSPGMRRSDANSSYLPAPAFGLDPQVTKRASPTFLLAAWFPELLWDGAPGQQLVDPLTSQVVISNGAALEAQALLPILKPDEMGHDGRTWGEVTFKLAVSKPLALASNLPIDAAAAIAGAPTYAGLFTQAFGDAAITPVRIAMALATYERTLVPDQTPWDAFAGGQTNALTPGQIAGMNLFNGTARCNLCHVPGLFTDLQFRNLGLRPIVQDSGRQAVTGNFADRGKFKMPSLRNTGLRAELFHAGGITNFTLLLNFYAAGGGTNLDNKDSLLQPLALNQQQRNQLTDFVSNALTDPRVAAEVAPFDRPTLWTENHPNGNVQFGPATSGTGGRVPTMLAEVPVNLGNVDFKVGIANARGGALATLAFALQPAPVGTTISGVPILTDVGAALLIDVALGGAPGAAGAGFGTVRFPFPAEPWLAGLTIYSEWFVWDAVGVSGVAKTRGAQLLAF